MDRIFFCFIFSLLMHLTYAQNGQVGIGISTPVALLHVHEGSSGATPSALAVAVFENNSHMGINLLTPNASESGVYFGNLLNSAHGAIVYNSTVPYGLAFRTNGNATRMVLTDIGNLGVGTNAPSDKLHINAITGDPFRIQVNSSTKFRVWNNGGTSIGTIATPPVNGLVVSGQIHPLGGIVSTTNPINIESSTDSVEIQAGNNRIVVYADGGIKIIASGAGEDIIIDAGANDLILRGGTVEVDALDVDIDASGTLALSAIGTVNVQGLTIGLNGNSAPVAKIGSTVTVSGSTGVVSGNGSATVFTQ